MIFRRTQVNSKDYLGFVITYKKDIIGVVNVDISLMHNHATISYYLAKETGKESIYA